MFTLSVRGSTLDVRFWRLKSIPALTVCHSLPFSHCSPVYPGWHWHWPVTEWHDPPFIHWQDLEQLRPYVPRGQDSAQVGPTQPGVQWHAPDTVSQLALFSHWHVSSQLGPYLPSLQPAIISVYHVKHPRRHPPPPRTFQIQVIH